MQLEQESHLDKNNRGMLSLNLPIYKPRVSNHEGKIFIFDPIRKKEVRLTQEEWVRQHFVNYLMQDKGYPSARIANEVCIQLHGLQKRCDTVIYNEFIEPLMIVEYKAPSVPVTQTVFDQIARYNMKLRVSYLIVSNGLEHFCCKIDSERESYMFLQEVPDYSEISL